MTDLSTFLKGAKAGQTISVPKSTYSLATLLILQEAGLTLLGNGSTLLAPVSGSPFLLAATGVHLDGFNCEKCASNFVTANEASCTVSNCNLGMESTTPAGSIVGGFGVTGSGAVDFTVESCNLGVVDDYPFYMQQNGFRVVNCTAKGSLKQATIRCDTPDGKTTPTGLVVIGGEFWKVASNVQTVEVRQGCLKLCGNVVVHGDMVTGQGEDGKPPFKPGQMGTCYLDGVTFEDIPAGNACVAVRYGHIDTIAKASVTFKSTLPMSQLVVVSGGQLTWV